MLPEVQNMAATQVQHVTDRWLGASGSSGSGGVPPCSVTALLVVVALLKAQIRGRCWLVGGGTHLQLQTCKSQTTPRPGRADRPSSACRTRGVPDPARPDLTTRAACVTGHDDEWRSAVRLPGCAKRRTRSCGRRAWRGDWRWPDAPWMISLASSGLGAGSVQARMASRSERHDWRAPDGGQ